MKYLYLFAFYAIFVILGGCGKSDKQITEDKNSSSTQQSADNKKEINDMNNSGEYKTVEIKTKGMSCSHCENSVKTEINKLQDIKEVIADAGTNTVKVTFAAGKTDIKAIETAIDEAGYEVVEVKQYE
jgi:copper chaperone